MRFVLDQDVDARVQHVISGMGHVAWTVANAGLSEAQDDDITLYAMKRRAVVVVVVTHDKEFSARRRRNPIGQHLHLDCRETLAREVVAQHLPEIVATVEPFDDVYVRLRSDGVSSSMTWS